MISTPTFALKGFSVVLLKVDFPKKDKKMDPSVRYYYSGTSIYATLK